MLTYNFCTQLIAKGRLQPNVGKRFRANIFVRWDGANTRFIISESFKNWDSDTQKATWENAVRNDFAFVYADQTVIFKTPGQVPLLHCFAVSYRPSQTIKYRTTEWTCNGQIVLGDLPITIKYGVLTTSGNVRERHVDKEKAKRYNAIVKNVMNVVTTRVKLDVWANSPARGNRQSINAYPSKDIPSLWDKVLAVDEENLESIEAIIEIAHNFSYDYNARQRERFGSQDSIRYLKNFFTRFKDRFLEHLGALEYR